MALENGQRLLLSWILFLFFYANFVKSVINKNKKAIVFINDYTTWITGLDIKSNIKHL